MKHVYTVGRRYSIIKGLSLILNSAVVVVFYFIYRYLFADAAPNFVGTPLALIFVCVWALIVWATLKVTEKIGDAIVYTVKENGLVMGKGDKAKTYPWSKFTGVEMRNDLAFHFENEFPAVFLLGEEKLVLNHYVGDLYSLAGEICEHIQDRVTIPEELQRQIHAMKGLS